eukprot:5542162-Pleurochrysis_carterae.AAC.2
MAPRRVSAWPLATRISWISSASQSSSIRSADAAAAAVVADAVAKGPAATAPACAAAASPTLSSPSAPGYVVALSQGRALTAAASSAGAATSSSARACSAEPSCAVLSSAAPSAAVLSCSPSASSFPAFPSCSMLFSSAAFVSSPAHALAASGALLLSVRLANPNSAPGMRRCKRSTSLSKASRVNLRRRCVEPITFEPTDCARAEVSALRSTAPRPSACAL